jgi:mono/diheme cytochrome c family protein
MPRILKILATVAAALAGLVVFAMIAGSPSSIDYELVAVDLDSEAMIERGRYVATAGNCGTCHTVEGGAFMAGGLPFETPFGTIYSTNISPDSETGIGDWTAEEFLVSVRFGVRPDGTHLYPAFPYPSFTRISDEDIVALYAYFQSIPAIAEASPDNELAFPFNIRALMGIWKALFFEPGVYVEDPARSEEWNRGAYLVEGLTHCGACHTPRNRLGAEVAGEALRGGAYLDRVGGGAYQTWSAPDITSSNIGLSLWSYDELTDYLESGRNDFLDVTGPMIEVVVHSTRHLDESDIDAMATYLQSMPGEDRADAAAPNPSIMGRGRTVYNLHCGTCHLPTGLGDTEMGPKLNRGSLVVQSGNPASMINTILYGPKVPDFEDLPKRWRVPMGEFRYELDDDEVAAVATYIRNSWDNRAGLVTPDQVARQR